MTPLWRKICEDRYLDECQSDPLYAGIIAEYMLKIVQGFFADDWIDFIWQPGRGYSELGEIVAFASVHTMLCAGDVYVTDIPVLSSPGKDADIEGNNRKLGALSGVLRNAQMPDHNFEIAAEFSPNYGAGYCDDGTLRWNGTLLFDEFQQGDPFQIVKICDGSLPLEVGTTDASTTLMHLLDNGGVARWPYGHEKIRLMRTKEHFSPACTGRVRGLAKLQQEKGGQG